MVCLSWEADGEGGPSRIGHVAWLRRDRWRRVAEALDVDRVRYVKHMGHVGADQDDWQAAVRKLLTASRAAPARCGSRRRAAQRFMSMTMLDAWAF